MLISSYTICRGGNNCLMNDKKRGLGMGKMLYAVLAFAYAWCSYYLTGYDAAFLSIMVGIQFVLYFIDRGKRMGIKLTFQFVLTLFLLTVYHTTVHNLYSGWLLPLSLLALMIVLGLGWKEKVKDEKHIQESYEWSSCHSSKRTFVLLKK